MGHLIAQLVELAARVLGKPRVRMQRHESKGLFYEQKTHPYITNWRHWKLKRLNLLPISNETESETAWLISCLKCFRLNFKCHFNSFQCVLCTCDFNAFILLYIFFTTSETMKCLKRLKGSRSTFHMQVEITSSIYMKYRHINKPCMINYSH